MSPIVYHNNGTNISEQQISEKNTIATRNFHLGDVNIINFSERGTQPMWPMSSVNLRLERLQWLFLM